MSAHSAIRERPLRRLLIAADQSLKRLALVRAAYGASLLVAPSAALKLVGERARDRGARRFARLLGARQLAQAAALTRWPTARSLTWAAAADLAHAASVVALAWRLPAHRRSLAVNTATALTFADLSLASRSRRLGSRR